MKAEDRFGELIAQALREEAGWRHLPSGFAAQLTAQASEGARPNHARAFKIAASVAVLSAFVSLAAWVGYTVAESEKAEEVVEVKKPVAANTETSAPLDLETEILSNQGENTMIARKMASLVGAAMVSVAVPAAELTSEPTFVFLRPETSSFWNTAPGSNMTVPIDYPVGASSAELQITGLNYEKTYTDITTDDFTFDLPAPAAPNQENVYDLTLTFNDVAQTVRTARLGLIEGLSPDAEGTTRCLAPTTSVLWRKVKDRVVLPIPYGTTSFTVDGVETATGLNGAQGWYSLAIPRGKTMSLGLVAEGMNYDATLVSPKGTLLLFR